MKISSLLALPLIAIAALLWNEFKIKTPHQTIHPYNQQHWEKLADSILKNDCLDLQKVGLL